MLSKKTLSAMALAAAASASPPVLAEGPTYVLGVPGAPTIYISQDAADNAWLAANNAYAAMSVAATTGGVSRVELLGAPRMELASAEAGFPLERAGGGQQPAAEGKGPRTGGGGLLLHGCLEE